jgi:predicted neuraminidase
VTKFLKNYALPALIVIGALVSLQSPRYIEPQFYLASLSSLDKTAPPKFNTYQVVSGMTPSVHSATSIELDNGNLLSMWYGGTREGHTDVALYSAVFDRPKGVWGDHKNVLDRYDVADSLNRYIKKIGNPILIKHPQGPIVLIYVSVSLAGWATSNLNMAVSYDEGQSWHDSKRLVTSPFLNISTLVKNDAVIYTDGTIGITAYHELKGEFSEMVRVNLNGDVVNQYRMTSGTNTIQPSVVVRSENDAIALIRDSSRDIQRVHLTETKDGGKSWSPYEVLKVKNPNSAVYGFSDLKGRSWMVFNDSTRDTEHSRNNLALAVAENDIRNWKTVHYFENPELDVDLDAKYAYPWLTKSSNNEYQLFYTVNRKSIKHIQFNQAWLEELL